MSDDLIIPVILCGGSGTRLWPVSREHEPKQFLSLTGDYSLLQETMRRAMNVAGVGGENIVTVTLEKLKEKVKDHLIEIDHDAAEHILCEPCARNTAAALAFAASYVRDTFGKKAIMWVLPADHHIGDEDALKAALTNAVKMARENYLVTFGISPSRPETGYGYIRVASRPFKDFIYPVEKFVEKPDFETASAYVESGHYLWNSGMFVFKTETVLDQYAQHAPDILTGVGRAIALRRTGQVSPEIYATLPNEPFDKAIMEKSPRVMTVCCDPSWSDIGSWESLWEIRSKDEDGNAIEGHAICQDTRDCLILGKTRLVACVGMENIVIVEMDDAILIADRNNPDGMKNLVKNLKNFGGRETVIPAAGQEKFTSTVAHYKHSPA